MKEDIFDGLKLREKQIIWLKNVHKHCSFSGKRVLEVGSDSQLQAAQAMLRLGAKEVVASNPCFANKKINIPNINITSVPAENLSLSDGYFDIIFGVALLEHVHHPKELAINCRRLLNKKEGFCFLQGSPIWTSYQGHHIICSLGGKEIRPDKNPPLEDWQHLCLETHNDAISAFTARQFTHDDAVFLAKKLLDDQHISRITPSEIIKDFTEIKDITIKYKRISCNKNQTKWYGQAQTKYSKEDLDTLEVQIMMWHPRSLFKQLKEIISCRINMIYT